MVTQLGDAGGRGGSLGTPAMQALAQSVRDGNCILFLGAGVHFPPPPNSAFGYPEELRPPLGGTLARELASACEFEHVCPGESSSNLQRVALCYEKELKRNKLVETIKQAVDDNSKPSAAVRALAELPFPLIMTTNYDTLFERALQRDSVDKRPLVKVYKPGRYERTEDFAGYPSMEKPFLFKMHGCVDHPDSIVVTDEDYITFVLRMNEGEEFHPIPSTFRYNLNRMPTLFVGYGLLDFNLRLLFRTMRWRLDPANCPSMYSVDVKPDVLVRDRWEHDLNLQFLVEDVWEFVPWLYREVLGAEMPS